MRKVIILEEPEYYDLVDRDNALSITKELANILHRDCEINENPKKEHPCCKCTLEERCAFEWKSFPA